MSETTQKLTGRQEAFIDYYLGVSRFNATDALRRAGSKATGNSLESMASQTLSSLKVQAAIAERLRRRAMTSEEVLARLAEQARGDIQDVIELTPGGVDRDRWIADLVTLLRTDPVDSDAVAEHLEREPATPGWRIDLEKAKRLGLTHLIRKVSYDTAGRPTLELYDAQAALVQLGRHHGLFLDRQSVETPAALQLLREMLTAEAPVDPSTGTPGGEPG